MAPKCINPDDDFYFDAFLTEDMTRYVPGGYHPVIIGNILGVSPGRQYRILLKLGWGYFGTVWLAERISETKGFVAVKVTTADNETQSQEVAMLRRAAEVSQPYVLNLTDHFKLSGPNGTHTVIVTEVVVPILCLMRFGQSPAWRKTVAYGLAQTVARLHANGIVHADIYVGNLGIAIPRLAHEDREEGMLELDRDHHDITIVLPCNSTNQTDSLPPYIIAPSDISPYYQDFAESDPPQVKLLDFGRAHEIGTLPPTISCAAMARAPEVINAGRFENIDNPAFDPPVDVYALGASIYEIITCGHLTRGGLVLSMSELTGRIPPHWEKWSASLSEQNVTITQSDVEKEWSSRRKYLRRGCESDEDTDMLVQLLRSIVVLDPTERPTAEQVLKHPWFSPLRWKKLSRPKVDEG